MKKKFIVTIKKNVNRNKNFIKKSKENHVLDALQENISIEDSVVLEYDEFNSYLMNLDIIQEKKFRENEDFSVEEDSFCALQDTINNHELEPNNDSARLYEEGYNQAINHVSSELSSKDLHLANESIVNQFNPKNLGRRYSQDHLSKINAIEAHKRATGRGVKLAVLDTGIDGSHDDLSVTEGVSFVSNHLIHPKPWYDKNTHGTKCAGIIAAQHNGIYIDGIAPDVTLYAVKVLDDNGKSQKSRVLAGMLWCLREGIDVISMSIADKVCPIDSPCSVAYDTATRKLEASGCVIVAAAGNIGAEGVSEPARCSSVIAVTAVDQKNNVDPEASWGPPSLSHNEGVEIAAPGIRIYSTAPNNRSDYISNTSAACPMVAAAAALIKQMHPTWTPQQIRQRLKDTATPLGATVKYGAGLLNCKKAVFGH